MSKKLCRTCEFARLHPMAAVCNTCDKEKKDNWKKKEGADADKPAEYKVGKVPSGSAT